MALKTTGEGADTFHDTGERVDKSMALKNTREEADTCHDTGERADTIHGTKEHWRKG
jgi:hypothetical protein